MAKGDAKRKSAHCRVHADVTESIVAQRGAIHKYVGD